MLPFALGIEAEVGRDQKILYNYLKEIRREYICFNWMYALQKIRNWLCIMILIYQELVELQNKFLIVTIVIYQDLNNNFNPLWALN